MCSIRILVYNEVNCPAQGACLQGDDPINAKVSAAPAVERLCDWLTENDEKTVTEALAHVIKEKMIPATEDDVSVAILYCGEDE